MSASASRTPLSTTPNLEQLRKQAKDLHKAHGQGSTDAVRRLRAHLARLAGLDDAQALAADLALRDCQLVVSREHGFAGWQELLAALEARAARGEPRSLAVDTVAYADADLVPAQILRVGRRAGEPPTSAAGWVLLRAADDRALMIVVGQNEASALARCLEGTQIPRPMTHELLYGCLQQLGARLEDLVIHTLDATGIYYAHLRLQTRDGRACVDTRPSDGLVLAAFQEAPVFVTPQVLDAGAEPMATVSQRLTAEDAQADADA